jgi:hypothetical protein
MGLLPGSKDNGRVFGLVPMSPYSVANGQTVCLEGCAALPSVRGAPRLTQAGAPLVHRIPVIDEFGTRR